MLRVLKSGDNSLCQLRPAGLRSPRPAWRSRHSRVLLRPSTQPGVKRAARKIWPSACAAAGSSQAFEPSDPSGAAGASGSGPNSRSIALKVVLALASGGLLVAGLWCLPLTDGKGKALLAFWLAQQLATLLPLSRAAMAMQDVLRKRLPGLVAVSLSAVWLASAHWLAQATLALPLSMVKVLLAYGPLRMHLWVPAAVESWVWQNASVFNTLFGLNSVVQGGWILWLAFLAALPMCMVQVLFGSGADPAAGGLTAGTPNVLENFLSFVARCMLGYSDAETAQPAMKSVQSASSSKQSTAPAEAAPAAEGAVQKGAASGSSSSSSGRPVEQWLQQGQELHATLPLGMPRQLPEWVTLLGQTTGPEGATAAKAASLFPQRLERGDVTLGDMIVEVFGSTSEAARVEELLSTVACLQADKARLEQEAAQKDEEILKHRNSGTEWHQCYMREKVEHDDYKEKLGRGLGLLHAHGTAMVRALRGEAEWEPVELKDPLRMSEDDFDDEEFGRQVVQRELEDELANIEEVRSPYGAIGSFVDILGAFRQKVINKYGDAVEQNKELQQKLEAAAKQAQYMQEADRRHISDLETLNKMLRRELDAVRKQVVAASGPAAASPVQRQLDTVQRQLRAEELQKQDLEKRLQGALADVQELKAAAELQKGEHPDLALHLEQAQAALKAKDVAHQVAVKRLEEDRREMAQERNQLQADNTELKAASEAKQAELVHQLEKGQSDSDAEDSDAEDSDSEDSDAEDSEAEDSEAGDSDGGALLDSWDKDSDAEDSDAEDSGAKDADVEDRWGFVAEETDLVEECGPDEECLPDAYDLGAYNTSVGAGGKSSDDEEAAATKATTTSDSDEEAEASDKEGDGSVEVAVAPELLPGQGGESSADTWTCGAQHLASFAVPDLDGFEDRNEVVVNVAAELLPQGAAEAAKAPSAIDKTTIYGSYNTTTGKVDLKGRWPQFLEAYAQLAPSQRIAVSELCSKLINTYKLPAGYAPDLAYYLVAVLKLDEKEVEQLEPDLGDHYDRLQSLATALGRGFMLYHRVKQSDPYLMWQRHGDDRAGLMHLLPSSVVARRLAGL